MTQALQESRAARPGRRRLDMARATQLAKAGWCRRRLVAWYEDNRRAFRWRSHDASLYEKVVTEVLLQRTQAATVDRLYQSFFERFRSWRDLASAEERALQLALAPIGLWRRRAQGLQGLARAMVTANGVFPRKREELEELPAVGQYVASAILLFAHNRSEPLLDANMARVLERVFSPRTLVDIRYDPHLQFVSRQVVRSSEPTIVNWAMLDLAALLCRSTKPACESCPLSNGCAFANARG